MNDLTYNYGNIAPAQSVDSSTFNMNTHVGINKNKIEEVSQRMGLGLDTINDPYKINLDNTTMIKNPDGSVTKKMPFDDLIVNDRMLNQENAIFEQWKQKVANDAKTTQAYNDLANEYGDIGGDGSANPIDMSGVPSNQSGFLSTLANVESGNKNITTPNKNGYVGIFQFRYRDGDHGSVLAKKMGVTPQQMINSPELQKKAMSLALNQYDRELSSSNIPVNNYTRWMRHNQGLGGTRAMTSGKLTPTIRRNIRNQGIGGKNDYELIQNYHKKFRPRFV